MLFSFLCRWVRQTIEWGVYMTLQDFFDQNPRVALAFSGGVDSAYLLYAAQQCGAQVRAYFVRSAFQPQFEADDAARLAQSLGAELRLSLIHISLRRSAASTRACCSRPR